jgi:DNA processing protein
VSLVTPLHPSDPEYPERLRALLVPPPEVTVEGDLRTASCAVAVVGTREPSREAEKFAFDLAGALAQAGAVVVSGGALGIDAAAHRGALAVAGRTWAVAATGRAHCFPKEHADLFRQIAAGPGAMLWPFRDDVPARPGNFHRRNGILVALADAVIIVQAGAPSGSLNAASWARKQERIVWAVPGPPWDPSFTGCRAVIEAGARTLTSIAVLLRELGLPGEQLALPLAPHHRPLHRVCAAPRIDDATGQALWTACTAQPRHIDQIAEDAGVCASTAATRLLTLALENVLVEGPEGFYRRTE